MSQRRIKKIVTFISGFLNGRGIKVSKLVLFGSYARGTSHKDSDVDIAIVSKEFSGKDIFERAEMLVDLNWSLVKKFKLPFDIVPISLDEWKKSSSLIVGFAKQGKNLLS